LMKAFFRRGLARFYLHDYDETIEDFGHALEQESRALRKNGCLINRAIRDRSLILGLRAEAMLQTRDVDLALNDADRAIECDSLNIGAYCTRGRVLGHRKQYNEAIATFDRAIELDPEENELYYYRGRIKELSDDLDGALNDFSTSLRLANDDEERSERLMRRASTWYRKGNFGKAERDLSRAIHFQPNNGRHYSKRAIVWKQLGNAANAAADEKRARELSD